MTNLKQNFFIILCGDDASKDWIGLPFFEFKANLSSAQ